MKESKRRLQYRSAITAIAGIALGIAVAHPAGATGTFSRSTILGNDPDSHKAKCIGVFSADNDNDIVVEVYVPGGSTRDGTYIFRGSTGFTSVSKISSYNLNAEEAVPADINGDGWNDIVIGGINGPTIWLQNPGANQYSTTWTQHTLPATGLGGRFEDSHDCFAADVDHDGKLDIVTTFGVFYQGATPDTWSFNAINGKADQGTSVYNVLANGDGYLDIVGEQANGDGSYSLGWWENPGHTGGTVRSSSWTFHVIDHDPGGVSASNAINFENNGPPMTTAEADFNRDGFPDVAFVYMYSKDPHNFGAGQNTTAGHGLVWYQCPSNIQSNKNATWTEHSIMPGLCWVHQDSLKIADFDGDGNLDIGFAEQEQSQFRSDGVTPTRRIGFVYSTFSGGTVTWGSPQLVSSYPSDSNSGGHNPKIGNIATDSRPSMITANHGFDFAPTTVFLQRNTTTGTNHATPFIKGTSQYIPGTIQAEDYDNGGEAVGYHDSDTTNNSHMYRTDGVDIEHATDTSGNYDVTGINSGEWTGYTVNVSSAGTYTINARVLASGTGSFHLVFGTIGSLTGTSTPEFNVTSTGGVWTNVPVAATLTAGVQWMRLVNDSGTGAYSINYFSITPGAGGGSLTAVPSTTAPNYVLTTLGTTDWRAWAVGIGAGNDLVTDNKLTGGSKISVWAKVNPTGGNWGTWNDTSLSLNWTDGNPTLNASNEGGFEAENADATLGTHGMSFTVPADTTSRTLVVITGGNTVASTVTAHLNDNSAPDYSNTISYGTTTTRTTYTITYQAASATTLTVSLLKTGNNGATLNGSVNLYAAYLTTAGGSAPAAPTGLGATGGNAQVTLNWTGSAGATSYNVYRGTTAGGESGTPISTGVVTTSFVDTGRTNGTAYFYKVAAVNGSGTSGFSNEASATPSAGVAGSLSGSVATASTGIYALTTLGTTDWAHWSDAGGGAPYIHKATGGSKISDVTKIGGSTTYGEWHVSTRNVSWTDGSPTTSNTDDINYIWNNGTTGQGWSFTVPAGTGVQTLNVLCGTSATTKAMKLVAHLSDGSATDYVSTLTSSVSVNTYLYTITYNAADNLSRTLTITLTNNDTQGTLSTDLMAAWLH